ncbi:MAG: hypothetical protein JSU61_04610 [Fidelibacterota bacterium]|nr:MAG: hypothetical protein JSU61_04610 [Candidatus Neomarinimicrobiota bacterium]
MNTSTRSIYSVLIYLRGIVSAVVMGAGILALCACGGKTAVTLTEVATSESLWTGVAVSEEGRIFVNYPRWFESVTVSVAELLPSGETVPYPDETWNSWNPDLPFREQFVCVQSVVVDKNDNLWILDPAPAWLTRGAPGGPKLLKVDLTTDQVIQIIHFDAHIAPPGSYLNDVRVDNRRNWAYLTDSGLGAIVAVDLSTRQARRVLANHPSTKAEDVVLVIEGQEYLSGDGSRPQIHSDGIALDAHGRYLYYQALTGHSLYRIPTAALHDTALSASELASKVELFATPGPADGIAFGTDGHLYLTSLELNAVRRVTPSGKVRMVVQDTRLKWPDSFAVSPDNTIYVTTSQIHLLGRITEPFRILKFHP